MIAVVMQLSTGFAQLRWGMSRQQARAIYPKARTTPTYEGRHPITKERVVVGGDELIPEIQEVTAGLPINATLTFDAADRLVQIELWPDLAVDPPQLLDGARRLAIELGLDAISEIPEARIVRYKASDLEAWEVKSHVDGNVG